MTIGVLTIVMAVANRSHIHGLPGTDIEDIVVPFSLGFVGALVASRQPRNPTGWLFLFVAVVAGLQGLTDQYARYALVTHPGAPGGLWALWLDSWVIDLVFPTGALVLLLLLFPDGHLPSRRWRPLAVFAVVITLVLAIPGGAFSPGHLTTETNFVTALNPIGVPSRSVVGSIFGALGVLWLPGLLVVAAAAAAPFVRMRRSNGDERQQLKWIAYAVVVSAAGAVVFSIADALLPGFPQVSDLAIALGFGCALPVAAGIAIFKHRLYDIDLVISRTLVYGSLAVCITAVYVGIAVGIGALIGGGGKPNLALSIVATAIVAVGFQPQAPSGPGRPCLKPVNGRRRGRPQRQPGHPPLQTVRPARRGRPPRRFPAQRCRVRRGRGPTRTYSVTVSNGSPRDYRMFCSWGRRRPASPPPLSRARLWPE